MHTIKSIGIKMAIGREAAPHVSFSKHVFHFFVFISFFIHLHIKDVSNEYQISNIDIKYKVLSCSFCSFDSGAEE